MILRRSLTSLLVMGSVYLVPTCLRAWHKPFWFDEINTLTIADLYSLRDIWKAETAGFDLNALRYAPAAGPAVSFNWFCRFGSSAKWDWRL